MGDVFTDLGDILALEYAEDWPNIAAAADKTHRGDGCEVVVGVVTVSVEPLHEGLGAVPYHIGHDILYFTVDVVKVVVRLLTGDGMLRGNLVEAVKHLGVGQGIIAQVADVFLLLVSTLDRTEFTRPKSPKP